MKPFINKYIASLILLYFVVAPQSVVASELIFKQLKSSDTVRITLDPDHQEINTVEGEISFSGAVSEGLFVSIENGHSVLPLWTVPPQYDDITKTIVFTGGIPNGLDEKGLLFDLQLVPTTYGALEVSLNDGIVYLNDGRGTKDVLVSQPFTLEISNKEKDTKTGDIFDADNVKYATILLVLIALAMTIFIYVLRKKNNQ